MHLSNQDEPITKSDLIDLVTAFSRVAKELSEEAKPKATTEQEPVTQTLNG